jgi:hypothetical protein
MMTRSRRETMSFLHPFQLKGVQWTLPAGTYEIISEDELIEGYRFRSTGA